MSAADKQAAGFWLWIEPWTGTDPATETRLMRDLEDYAEQHGLQMTGAPLQTAVIGQDRELSLTDQVDLINWLLCQSTIRTVVVSPLTHEVDGSPYLDEGLLRVPAVDLRVVGVSLLYRLGHLRPEQYVEILGGYVRRVH